MGEEGWFWSTFSSQLGYSFLGINKPQNTCFRAVIGSIPIMLYLLKGMCISNKKVSKKVEFYISYNPLF